MCNTSIEAAKAEARQEIDARQEFKDAQAKVARQRENDARMQSVLSRASGRVHSSCEYEKYLNQSQSCKSSCRVNW